MAENPWDGWSKFVSGTCDSTYKGDSIAASYPCVFDASISSVEGQLYGSSSAEINVFQQAHLKPMSDAIRNGDAKIFSDPPPGFTFVRTVDGDDDFKILCGRKKKPENVSEEDKKKVAVVYAGVTPACLHVCLCTFSEHSKGAETTALRAFNVALSKAMEHGV